MNRIGIIYGSDTGVTEDITQIMVGMMADDHPEVIEVDQVQEADFHKFDLLLIGLSTWYDGDLQSDWEDYYETFKTLDFSDQIVAFYGLGDQYGYAEYFIDGVGILAKVVLENGGTVIGSWPSAGYEFTASKALKDDTTFYGLALDEDNQPELTEDRLQTWLAQVKQEFASIEATKVS
ncbi:MAG: flavodoxin [Bacteroidota bacterium]